MTVSINLRQDGPPDAPALLLIHGTGASLRSWDPMVPLLTDSLHVIRIDLPGCGGSAKPESYAVPAQARLVGEALDRIGVEHAAVVGHSSGSAFATALTEERPDLVSALVFISFGPNMGAYIAEEIDLGDVPWPDLSDEQVRRLMRSGFRPGYEIPQEYVDQFRDIDLQVFAAETQSIRAYLKERGLPERLAPLGKPLLVLFGEQDLRWAPSSAAEYRAVPGAQIELLAGAGHSPNLEDPPRTARYVLSFAANGRA
ncbi:alpha/beta fold hydrolase [Amycolatopsis acidicola]|uniref:Alpha/beta fold hydrolase n=1 Tax=Amycolatopsis acidicola TaxID=2596893 RepID=A0A5N0UN39_9PSEU|nr:alpha/beta fold hydrolase [Amycolatopsis acidicola]KAA9148523.1 alpha/beta fold hydrolase [Amycolatopsis acidicola]